MLALVERRPYGHTSNAYPSRAAKTKYKMTRYAPATLDDDDESMPVSQRVVYAVAAETDADPLQMDPLYAVVDPESLDELFASTKHGPPRSTGSVTFRYADCTVTVHAGGDVDVTAAVEAGSTSQADSTAVN